MTLTQDEKFARAQLSGAHVEFLTCPLCGFHLSLNRYANGLNYMNSIDLSNYDLFTVRIGGGRGAGFFREDSLGMTLTEMKEDSRFTDFLAQIKAQCKDILKILE